MELNTFLAPERVVVDLAVADKEALLVELGCRAGAMLGMEGEAITQALENREKLGSTGLGSGFALPHARLEGLDRFFGMFVRLARPIPFDSVDDLPVSLVFLLLSPSAASAGEHLAALAAISRRMRDPEMVRRLRSRTTAARLFADLVGGGGKEAA